MPQHKRVPIFEYFENLIIKQCEISLQGVMVQWLAFMTPMQEVSGSNPGIFVSIFFCLFRTSVTAEVQTTFFLTYHELE